MKNHRLLRKGTSVMLAFLLSLLLWATLVMTGCLSGILRENVLMQAVDESKYYEKSYEAFRDQAEALLEEAGLANGLLNEVLPLKKFYIDEKQCMQSILNKEDTAVTEEGIKEEVKSGITAYYNEAGISMTSELEAVITETSDILASEYVSWIQLNFLSGMSEYWKGIRKNMMIAVPIGIILMVAVAFAICSMYRYKHKGLRYVVSGAIGGTLLQAASVVYLKQKVDYKAVVSGPVCYQDFLDVYFNRGIATMEYQIIAGAIIAIILVTVLCVMRRGVTGE